MIKQRNKGTLAASHKFARSYGDEVQTSMGHLGVGIVVCNYFLINRRL